MFKLLNTVLHKTLMEPNGAQYSLTSLSISVLFNSLPSHLNTRSGVAASYTLLHLLPNQVKTLLHHHRYYCTILLGVKYHKDIYLTIIYVSIPSF